MIAPAADLLTPPRQSEFQRYGRLGPPARAIVPFACAWCGAAGQGIAIRQYCSVSCQTAAQHQRRRQRRQRLRPRGT